MKRRDFLGVVGGGGLLAFGTGRILALGQEPARLPLRSGRPATGPGGVENGR